MRSNALILTITLLISSYTIFAPLEAWIDHFFDFHPVEIEADWMGSKEEWERNYSFAEIREKSQDRDRDSDRGTMLEGPDRDK